MKTIFVSHPFSAAPNRNRARVRAIARSLVSKGHLPLAPQLYVPAFIDEATEREVALTLCQWLVGLADEVWVYDTPTEGMVAEIAEANRLGIPVIDASLEPIEDHPEPDDPGWL